MKRGQVHEADTITTAKHQAEEYSSNLARLGLLLGRLIGGIEIEALS